MTYNELVNAVYVETNRPDLVDRTNSAIQAATLKMHSIDFWYKDIKEALVTFPFAAYMIQFETTLLTRYRALAYIRKYDMDGQDPFTSLYTGAPGNFVEITDFASVLDSYKNDRSDIAYVGGTAVNMRLSTEEEAFLIGWYCSPLYLQATYDSWIARENPYAIIYDAASKVFTAIGQQEMARKYDSPETPISEGGLVAQQVRILRMTNTTAKGY